MQIPWRHRGEALARRIAALLALAALEPGCWVPLESGRKMALDIQALKEDLSSTRRSVDEQRAELTEQLAQASSMVTSVDKKIEQLNRAARKTDAGLGVRMDDLQKELQELRGQIELLAFKISQLEPKAQQVDELVKRFETLGETLPPSREPSGKTAPDPAPPAPAAKTLPKDSAGLLAHGKTLVKQNKNKEARGVFREVIRKWPKTAGTTDDAFFQIGETYYHEKQYRAALQEYIKIVENFGKGKIVDDAYYRIGLCSRKLGNLEDALIFFEEVVKNHKGSSLVGKAKAQIKEIRGTLAKEKRSP